MFVCTGVSVGKGGRICVYVCVMCDFVYAPCVHECVVCVSLRTCQPCVYMYVQCMCDCVCVSNACATVCVYSYVIHTHMQGVCTCAPLRV